MTTLDAVPAIASRRAQTARRALLGAALLGILADLLLRNPPWGAGLVAWVVALAAVVVVMVRKRGGTLSRESALWLTVAVLFAAGLSWRDAEMLQAFDVMAMLVALGLLAMSLRGAPVTSLSVARIRDLASGAFWTAVEVGTGAPVLVLRDAELETRQHTFSSGTGGRIVKALLITVPLVIVFATLLTSADPLFASFVTLPPIDFGLVFSHIAVAGFFAWIVAGWLRRWLFPRTGNLEELASFPFTLGRTDIAIALGALNLLFAAFVIVQIGWLFGGAALVLQTTGLSYAEYARRGFFELLGVAGLVLPMLLVAQAMIPSDDASAHRLYRRLSLPLVLLLGAMMASAGARMQLYVHYYGLSSDRLFASAFMIWLAIVFLWFVLTVLRSRPQLFAAGFVVSGFAVLFALNCLNPDGLVARDNLARGEMAHDGMAGADLRYLATLRGDAVPTLVTALTNASAMAEPLVIGARCEAANALLDRWTGERAEREAGSWTQWSVAQARGLAAVRAHEDELRRLDCSAAPARP